ncbi:MAG: hypothetical protein ILNGONEN_02160 [Syntrophorhabdaceae bacterium]|nr:hypothetical protein [Syntrophorhabdaceae bacterium]
MDIGKSDYASWNSQPHLRMEDIVALRNPNCAFARNAEMVFLKVLTSPFTTPKTYLPALCPNLLRGNLGINLPPARRRRRGSCRALRVQVQAAGAQARA